MLYFTSDLHLGHENVIKMCGRPFENIDEMDNALIDNWNAVVHANDDVYILGDLMFRFVGEPQKYLDRLKGKKRLIVGNHDKSWLSKVDLQKYFASVERIAVINTGQGKATLCHYPMFDGEGRFLIHGHLHNRTDYPFWPFIKDSGRLLNAGADVNGFRPVNLEQLISNNKRFKEEH